jgi:hypothetical protein
MTPAIPPCARSCASGRRMPASIVYGVIIGLTAVGAETVRAMRFHAGGPEGALAERYTAILRGIYPPPWLRAAYNL